METNKNQHTLSHDLYADVILPLAVPFLYTYQIPLDFQEKLKPGNRVIVQLGNRKLYTAIVYSTHSNKPKDYVVKPIESLLDEKSITTNTQLQLWDWIADYYMCTRGEVMKAALPAGLKLESEMILYCNPDFSDFSILENDEELLFSAIQNSQSLTLDNVRKILSKNSVMIIVQKMLQKRILITGEKVNQSYKPKKELRYSFAGDINSQEFVNDSFEMVSKAPKQQQVFLALIDICITSKNPNFSISRKDVLTKCNATPQILQDLVKKQILHEFENAVSRINTQEIDIQESKKLSEVQNKAYNQINKSFETHDVCLLHGITASGKTEIYIQLISEAIAQGKQVLYLLPEIALTSQIINRLRKVFGNQIGVYHSKFSDNERVEVWNNLIAQNEHTFRIILGVRSSVFLPFSNLGLVIIDEEHETSFKQFDPAPRYNARDTAMVLARFFKAKTLLGTATPSIESYYNVLQSKFAIVELMQRHSKVALPEISVIDLAKAKRQKRMFNKFLSKDLLNEISNILEKKEQVILFQNRRGFSPFVECSTCGNVPKCIHCDVSLTFHKFSNTLICHYCGYSIKNTSACRACGSSEIEYLGLGTEQIETIFQEIYPNAKIARMDLDTTRAKNGYGEIIEKFENREIDILIGTQMITKGLDFENVGLVGILNADTMLNMPDFRAFERGFHLMVQVAGRAGRSMKQGKVLLQTYSPDLAIISQIANHDYMSMMKTQMTERKNFNYPPFVKLLRISIKHKDKDICSLASEQLAQQLRNTFGKHILGPEFPTIPRIQSWYIKDILIKIPKDISLEKSRKLIQNRIQELQSVIEFKGIQCVVNMDPY